MGLFRKEKLPMSAHAGMTKEQQYSAIRQAGTPDELRTMWEAWRATGHSEEGLLHAAVLERLDELGEPLTAEDRARIRQAKLRRAHGASLPPITGKRGG